jgi:hypothetical protein
MIVVSTALVFEQPHIHRHAHTPQKLNTLDLASEVLEKPEGRSPVFSASSYGTCSPVRLRRELSWEVGS